MDVPAGDPWSTMTPEKSEKNRRPSWNRNAAFSLSHAAEDLVNSDLELSDQGDSTMSSVGERVACCHESSAVKANLPEKYEMLAKFFKGLDSSIRLLQLRGSLLSFKNIKPAVEALTDRRFTHSHVAQLKFILPEAIQIKDGLKDDSDFFIALNPSAVVDEGKVKSGSANLDLWKIFEKRLFDFLEAHPEEDDIPEAELHEPFNKSEHDTPSKAPVEAVSEQKHHVCHNLSKPLASASHLAQSFRPSFSQRNSLSMKEETKRDQTVCNRKAYETSSKSQHLEFSSKPNSTSCLSHVHTPIRDAHPSKFENGTLPKLASTPAKVMASTPVFPPPLKRCYMSPEDESSKSSNKLVRRSCRGRLAFDMPAENASSADQAGETGKGSSDYKDLLGV